MCFCDVHEGGSNRLDMYTVDEGLRNEYAWWLRIFLLTWKAREDMKE
jgi:hypothetical protein